MSQLAAEIESVRVELASACTEFMVDTCDLVITVSTPDGFGGTTESESIIEADVPLNYEAMTNPMQKQLGGSELTTLTHILTLPATANTKVIRPHYKIVVHALNDQPELTFLNPVTLDGSFSVFVKLAAELAE